MVLVGVLSLQRKSTFVWGPGLLDQTHQVHGPLSAPGTTYIITLSLFVWSDRLRVFCRHTGWMRCWCMESSFFNGSMVLWHDTTQMYSWISSEYPEHPYTYLLCMNPSTPNLGDGSAITNHWHVHLWKIGGRGRNLYRSNVTYGRNKHSFNSSA